jgi:hypothetical protein
VQTGQILAKLGKKGINLSKKQEYADRADDGGSANFK